MSTANEHYLTECYYLSLEEMIEGDAIQDADSMNHDKWHTIFSCPHQGYYNILAIGAVESRYKVSRAIN